MLSQTLQDALNEQANFEFYSAYIYYAMRSYLADQGLAGAASWMKSQTVEEMVHADKLVAYIADRGGRPRMAPIEGPDNEWDSPLAAFQTALAHEREVTRRINRLMDLALEERDHNTANFLQWFIAEQVEEEASVDEIVQKLKLVERSGGGLFMLDRELGQRALLPSSLAGGA